MADAFASRTLFADQFLASAAVGAAVCLAAALLWSQSTAAQSREAAAEPALASCDQFLPSRQQVGDKRVGPDKCLIVFDEIVFDLKGRPFRRLELRISGTVAGFAVKQGPRSGYFNDAPDLVFTQSGNDGPRFAGVGRYEGATGHGMSLFLPLNAGDWNGKLFVTAHGAGPYGGVGTLIPRHAEADFNPLTNLNRYVGLMIDRGYAVAHTLRSSHIVGGDVVATLDDGTVLPKNNVSSHAGFIAGFTAIAENIVRQRLGRDTQRRYFYGFSAGSMMGRHVQYLPGANKGLDGRRLFDGFLLDDAGGGMWLPILKVDGKDVLFGGRDAERFVPQIDISHALYLGDTGDFLKFKRENARLLAQKGLGDRHRMYEIRGVSHFDAGQTSLPDLVPETLDLGGLMESFIDMLDRWVDKGIAPPPTRSDVLEIAGGEHDGKSRNPAIALPEVACPLGERFVFPPAHGISRRSFQETAFAAFDGANLEPLDGHGGFVDMNYNGIRDRRETVGEAWARLGLIMPGEPFGRRAYVACVASAAAKLVGEGFLPPGLIGWYVRRAELEAGDLAQ
jgi:Alpha/beta hydrolase domain